MPVQSTETVKKWVHETLCQKIHPHKNCSNYQKGEMRSAHWVYEPKYLYWCSFQGRHSQACFCFLWLCGLWKLMLFSSTLKYLNGLKRANMRKDMERNRRKWCWIAWESLSKNKKLTAFPKISLEGHIDSTWYRQCSLVFMEVSSFMYLMYFYSQRLLYKEAEVSSFVNL